MKENIKKYEIMRRKILEYWKRDRMQQSVLNMKEHSGLVKLTLIEIAKTEEISDEIQEALLESAEFIYEDFKVAKQEQEKKVEENIEKSNNITKLAESVNSIQQRELQYMPLGKNGYRPNVKRKDEEVR